MGAATKDRPSAAEMREQKAEREAAEAAKIAEAHAALGTDTGAIDEGPQDVYDGDPDELDDEPVIGNAQLSFTVGGKRPTTTGLRLTGGKIDVPGSFPKGAKIVLRVEARIGEVAFVDETDAKTGQIIGCQRRHKARILNVQVQ